MLKSKYVGPGFKQLSIQKFLLWCLKLFPSAAFTPPGFGFVYFKMICAALSLISKSSQPVSYSSRDLVFQISSQLQIGGHPLISSLVFLTKSKILPHFFIWRTSLPVGRVLLKEGLNYRSQLVYLALFNFICVNHSIADIVQEIIWGG